MSRPRADLEAFFKPSSVAVLGPVNRDSDSAGLLDPIRARYGGYALLDGARGRPRGDVEALLDIIEGVARLADAAHGRLAELDLNPVVVTAKGAIAVDS